MRVNDRMVCVCVSPIQHHIRSAFECEKPQVNSKKFLDDIQTENKLFYIFQRINDDCWIYAEAFQSQVVWISCSLASMPSKRESWRGGDTNRSKWRKRIEWHARYVCLKKFEILNYKISTFVSLHWVWWCWWCWRWWWTLINWI